MSGRFALVCNREDEWVFFFYDGVHEVPVRVGAVALNEWTHIVVSFDGTTLRAYIDAVLQVGQLVSYMYAIYE
jgi:hypothetical protein